MAQAGKEAVWISRISKDLEMPELSNGMCLKTDSQSAIKLAKNPEYH